MDTDEDYQVVFAYEGEPTTVDTFSDALEYGTRGGRSVDHGGITGFLSAIEPQAEGMAVGATDCGHLRLRFQQADLVESVKQVEADPERVDALLDVVRDVYTAPERRPVFVYGLTSAESEAVTMAGGPAPADRAALAEGRINYAAWLSLFSPRLVDAYGRETLSTAPVWHAAELDDGAVLLVHTDDPFALRALADLNEWLGISDSVL